MDPRGIAARAYGRYYRLAESPVSTEGFGVSCGLTLGCDGFTERMLDDLIRRGLATEITKEEWLHSGCQSRCVRRGDATCGW
jgi:serine/threonine protein phosphatase PrpC